MTKKEENIVLTAQELAANNPEVRTPSLAFKRDWAYGNAGLEDERITREQVEHVIEK